MKYNELKEKYGLPRFEELNKEINLEDIEDDFLRNILDKLYEKTSNYAKIIEDLLQPEASLANMYEANYISGKVDLDKVYVDIMKINRELLLARFEYSEEKSSIPISKAYKDWKDIKPDVNKVLELLRDSWKDKIDEKKYGGYFG